MKLNQIITSLLETDMYKFSMGEAIYHQFSDYKTTWTFKCRNTDVHFTAEMVQEIKEQIKAYCSLRFTEEELEYLNRITWIKGSYIDFLRLWQPRYEDFKISDEAECGLSIETFGTWLNIFHTALRFTNFQRVFFYVNRSQQVLANHAFVQYDSILIVISLPWHISNQQVFTQS